MCFTKYEDCHHLRVFPIRLNNYLGMIFDICLIWTNDALLSVNPNAVGWWLVKQYWSNSWLVKMIKNVVQGFRTFIFWFTHALYIYGCRTPAIEKIMGNLQANYEALLSVNTNPVCWRLFKQYWSLCRLDRMIKTPVQEFQSLLILFTPVLFIYGCVPLSLLYSLATYKAIIVCTGLSQRTLV